MTEALFPRQHSTKLGTPCEHTQRQATRQAAPGGCAWFWAMKFKRRSHREGAFTTVSVLLSDGSEMAHIACADTESESACTGMLESYLVRIVPPMCMHAAWTRSRVAHRLNCFPVQRELGKSVTRPQLSPETRTISLSPLRKFGFPPLFAISPSLCVYPPFCRRIWPSVRQLCTLHYSI